MAGTANFEKKCLRISIYDFSVQQILKNIFLSSCANCAAAQFFLRSTFFLRKLRDFISHFFGLHVQVREVAQIAPQRYLFCAARQVARIARLRYSDVYIFTSSLVIIILLLTYNQLRKLRRSAIFLRSAFFFAQIARFYFTFFGLHVQVREVAQIAPQRDLFCAARQVARIARLRYNVYIFTSSLVI